MVRFLRLSRLVLKRVQIMDEAHPLRTQRRQKIEQLRHEGINPFVNRFPITAQIAEVIETLGSLDREKLESEPQKQTLGGRLMAKRGQGKLTFCDIRDGTGKIQVLADKKRLGEATYTFLQSLDIGDFIGIRGFITKTRRGELSIAADEVSLLTKSLRPLPEKWHGLKDVETRYRQRYVDLLMNPEVREVFRSRSLIIQSLRSQLTHRGFVEVETPMMQPIVGGATARPFVTQHNALDMTLYLRVAPELYLKRLVVGGIDRVFEVNRNFRNEGISTEHNPEFTMLEFYMAYADYSDMMELVETVLVAVVDEVLGTRKVDWDSQEIDLSPPWQRLSLREALQGVGMADTDLVDEASSRFWAEKNGIDVSHHHGYGKVLNKILEFAVEPKLVQPTFLFDYPRDVSPLAKQREDNPEIAERFELFIGGREIGNAYSELNDPDIQRELFEDQVRQREMGDEEAQMMDHDYLRALEYGMPPTSGCGIGIDRLVMLLTQQQSIRDVIFFPQLRKEIFNEEPAAGPQASESKSGENPLGV